MDKTARLFALMDALRRHRRPVTAAQLAEELGVSVRTLCTDEQTLIGLGAPVAGEECAAPGGAGIFQERATRCAERRATSQVTIVPVTAAAPRPAHTEGGASRRVSKTF